MDSVSKYRPLCRALQCMNESGNTIKDQSTHKNSLRKNINVSFNGFIFEVTTSDAVHL